MLELKQLNYGIPALEKLFVASLDKLGLLHLVQMVRFFLASGDALYRSLDAVERLKQQGLDVGLINKPTLNVVESEAIAKIGKAPFVLVVESFNRRTGLGSRFGSVLLERGFTPKYAYLGTHKEGCGGLSEQFLHQGIDPVSIINKVKELHNS